ncbi:MAG: sulfur carrier protein ThiS adenylyltransferase ThiF [Candidatus Omnitrophota bacterium]
MIKLRIKTSYQNFRLSKNNVVEYHFPNSYNIFMNYLESGLNAYFSESQLQKIRACRIGVAGAGGLGSNIAMLLVRCGFVHFYILDFDLVEEKNLNRQFFFPSDVGKPKVEALSGHLLQINPGLKIRVQTVPWPEASRAFNPDPFFSCDILFEAFDRPETKAHFVDHYCDKVPYLISGNGMAGIAGPEITSRRHANVFFVGDATSEAEKLPPLAPRVMICAAKMADIALRLVLNF